jgi:hypothetical protein
MAFQHVQGPGLTRKMAPPLTILIADECTRTSAMLTEEGAS